MKILAISDIYEDIELIEQLRKKFCQEQIDIVLITGGIGFYHPQRSKEYNDNVNRIFGILSSIGEKVIFVPGGTDPDRLQADNLGIINIDKDGYLFDEDIKIGFLGLGGVPRHSIRNKEEFQYTWDEGIFFDSHLKKLKVAYEKVEVDNPDYFILVTHSPPYKIADYAKKITLNILSNVEEFEEEDKPKKEKKKEKVSTNPVHLGSRIIREFLNRKKIDIHIFGHVHKKGGSKVDDKNAIFFNVSHLSPDPYRLTGRKYLLLELTKDSINYHFDSLVEKILPFEDFLIKYL